MKMRQHKHRSIALQSAWTALCWFDRRMAQGFFFEKAFIQAAKTPEQRATEDAIIDALLGRGVADRLADAMARDAAEDLLAVEAAKQEYICVKVSDGTVINTFDLFEDADQLVAKHVRQKKAKLQILDSITGEVLVAAPAGA